jgi:hypothetical protein
MTTDPHDEHGEILRRALHAEADQVIPGADGLEKIRARIDQRPRARFGWQWLPMKWARPLAAVAAAAVVTFLGVTAPQAIELIQATAGNQGPSQPDGGGTANGGRSTQGVPPNARPPAPPQPSGKDGPRPSGSTSPSTAPGTSGCGAAVAAPTPPGASAGPETAATGAPEQPCASGSEEPPPATPTPPDPVTTTPDPDPPVSPTPAPEETPPPQPGEGPGE